MDINFFEKFVNVYARSFPLKKICRKSMQKPWYDSELKKLKQCESVNNNIGYRMNEYRDECESNFVSLSKLLFSSFELQPWS